jgi:hypothetical protein
VNQPKRWLDSAPNPKIRDLLRSGLTDDPDAQALPRTAAALGLGAAVTVVSSSAAALAVGGAAAQGTLTSSAAAGASATSATSAVLAAGNGTASALLVGKWLAVGFLSGGIASAGLTVAQTGFGPQSHEAPQVAASVPAAKRAALPARSRAIGSNPIRVAPAPPVPSRNEAATTLESEPSPAVNASPARATLPAAKSATLAVPATPKEAGRKPNETRGPLAAEIAWIDSARRALANGDADRALAELDAFERARTLGVLDREAGLLRIDALRKKGEVARARSVAQRYLGAFPGDAHAPRLREFLDSTEAER